MKRGATHDVGDPYYAELGAALESGMDALNARASMIADEAERERIVSEIAAIDGLVTVFRWRASETPKGSPLSSRLIDAA